MCPRRRPFAGKTDLEVLQTIIHGTFAPLPEAIPLPLRIAVEKALEKDPAAETMFTEVFQAWSSTASAQ